MDTTHAARAPLACAATPDCAVVSVTTVNCGATDASNHVINEEQHTLVERLLREKISLHGICRAVGVSIRWLIDFMVARFQALPDYLHVQPVASPGDVIMGRLEAEADEMWSFVKQKTNRQWVWIAMDRQTR